MATDGNRLCRRGRVHGHSDELLAEFIESMRVVRLIAFSLGRLTLRPLRLKTERRHREKPSLNPTPHSECLLKKDFLEKSNAFCQQIFLKNGTAEVRRQVLFGSSDFVLHARLVKVERYLSSEQASGTISATSQNRLQSE